MRQIEKITKNGKEILYLDFSGLTDAKVIIEQMNIYGNYITSQLPNSQLTLTNLDGMFFNTEVYNAFTAYVKKNNPYVRASVVIGLKGMMKIFYKGFVKITGRSVKVCNTYEAGVSELISAPIISSFAKVDKTNLSLF